jgi:general secretion pathway protein G
MDLTDWLAVSTASSDRELVIMQTIAQQQTSRPRRTRRVGRHWQRGVTLFEVLIVVAILAMVAGGVAVVGLPRFREAQVKTARTAAQTIRSAVHQWQLNNGDSACPTVSQLVEEKYLDKGTTTVDPWNLAFSITCTESEVTVMSSGPDKKKGTPDDVSVPAAGSPTKEGE